MHRCFKAEVYHRIEFMFIVIITLSELAKWQPFFMNKNAKLATCAFLLILLCSFFFFFEYLTPSNKAAILLKKRIYCPVWKAASAALPQKNTVINANRMRAWAKCIEIYIPLNHFATKFFNKMYEKWCHIIWEHYGSHAVCIDQ